jgi:hypothetical protein
MACDVVGEPGVTVPASLRLTACVDASAIDCAAACAATGYLASGHGRLYLSQALPFPDADACHRGDIDNFGMTDCRQGKMFNAGAGVTPAAMRCCCEICP